MEPILCPKCGSPKEPMRNKRNAPMLGCPNCSGAAKKISPPAAPTPERSPAPAKPKGGWGTIIDFYSGAE